MPAGSSSSITSWFGAVGPGLSGIGEGGGGYGEGVGIGRLSAPAAKRASGTNNQVHGVDEADIVKNDGRYVYLVANGALRIVEALNPRVLSITRFKGTARVQTASTCTASMSPGDSSASAASTTANDGRTAIAGGRTRRAP